MQTRIGLQIAAAIAFAVVFFFGVTQVEISDYGSGRVECGNAIGTSPPAALPVFEDDCTDAVTDRRVALGFGSAAALMALVISLGISGRRED